jgi:hypothetical protein
MSRTGLLYICLCFIIALGVLTITACPSLAEDENSDLLNQILRGPPIALSPEFNHVQWMVDYPNLSRPLRVNQLAPEDCVGDANDDGILDFIFVESGANLICLDGSSGEVLWRSDIDVNQYSSLFKCLPSMIDIEGDGDLEVVVGAEYGRLAFLDASTGELQHSVLLGNVATKPQAVDLDGDGYLDIVVGISSPAPNPTVACVSGRTHSPLWKYNGTTPVEERPAIADVDGDGRMEVIVAETGDRLVCLNGLNGSIQWTSDEPAGMDTFPIVADLVGNDEPEIIVAGNQIKILRSDDGESIRTIDVNHIGYLLVGNLDVDEDPEVLAVQFDLPRFIITIIDGDTYEEIQDVPASFNNWYLRDLDGDRIDEVIVSDGHRLIWAYYPYHKTVEVFSRNHTLESITDIDGDGFSEILVSDGEHLSLVRSNDPEIELRVGDGTVYPDYASELEMDVRFQAPDYRIERIEMRLGHELQWLTLAFDGNDTNLILEDDLSGTVSIVNATVGPPSQRHGIILRTQLVFAWDCPLRDWIDGSMMVTYNDGLVKEIEHREMLRIEYGIHLGGDPSITVIEGNGPIDGKWVSNGSTIRLQGILVLHDGPMGPLVGSSVFGIEVRAGKDVVLSIDRGDALPELDMIIEVVHTTPEDPVHNLTLGLTQTVTGCVPGADMEIELLVDVMPPLVHEPEPRGDSWVNSTWLRCAIWTEDPIGPGVDLDEVRCMITSRDGSTNDDWMSSTVIEMRGKLVKHEVVVPLPDDGPYLIQWRVVDLLGNHATIPSYQVNRDTDPPQFKPVPFEYWDNSPDRTFMVDIIDEGSGIDHPSVRSRLSDNMTGGGEWNAVSWEDGATAVVHWTTPSSGDFEMVLEAVDMVGNRASIILRFGVDLEPPSLHPDVPWIINMTGSIVMLDVGVFDPGMSGIGPAGLEFTLGEIGSSWSMVPISSVVSDGVITISFHLNADSQLWLRGTDLAGNPTDVIGPFELNLNEPPLVVITRPLHDGSYTNPVKVDGRASTDPEGLDLEFVWILDGTKLDSEKPLDDIRTQIGTHMLILEVDDGFHTNRSSPIEFEVIEVVSPLRSPYTVLLMVVVVLAILTTFGVLRKDRTS